MPKPIDQARADIAKGDYFYAEVFAGTSGEAVLNDLIARFVNRTSIVPGDPYMTHAKEGAREVVLYIQQRIRKAHERVDE